MGFNSAFKGLKQDTLRSIWKSTEQSGKHFWGA